MAAGLIRLHTQASKSKPYDGKNLHAVGGDLTFCTTGGTLPYPVLSEYIYHHVLHQTREIELLN
jgi:hypothetical protein